MTLGLNIQKYRLLTSRADYTVHTFSHAHEELATCSVCARVVALVFCTYAQVCFTQVNTSSNQLQSLCELNELNSSCLSSEQNCHSFHCLLVNTRSTIYFLLN